MLYLRYFFSSSFLQYVGTVIFIYKISKIYFDLIIKYYNSNNINIVTFPKSYVHRIL